MIRITFLVVCRNLTTFWWFIAVLLCIAWYIKIHLLQVLLLLWEISSCDWPLWLSASTSCLTFFIIKGHLWVLINLYFSALCRVSLCLIWQNLMIIDRNTRVSLVERVNTILAHYIFDLVISILFLYYLSNLLFDFCNFFFRIDRR